MILQVMAGTSGAVIQTTARVVGTAVFAGILALGVSLCYRWYVRERVPVGLALLIGLSGVAVVAGTTSLLAQEIAPGGGGADELTALLNIVTFVVGGVGAHTGMRVGDALGIDLFAATNGSGVDADVSELVQTVGRVISVRIPDDIDDIVGYDPVPEATRETLAGRRFLFPRRLTQSELRERFVTRLKSDYGVGHVDVEFDESGGIEYLALGSRAAGIGPTLPPATNAVAIRADPANAASAGDLVQVWETDPMRRVLTGELRGVAGEVVTVAIDAADTPKLDPTKRYKLVTLPVQDRPDREFASLLRAADETLATITVQTGSRADGASIGALGVTAAAVTRDDEPPDTLPSRDRTLRGGDVIYAIATPDALRKLEAAAEAPDDVVVVDETATDSLADDSPDDESFADDSTDGDSFAGDGDDERVRTDRDASDEGDAQPAASERSTSSGQGSDAARRSSSDEPEVPSGDAFPDTEELPGLDPETVIGGESDDSEGNEVGNADSTSASDIDGDDETIPDSAAFPDTDDLAGIDLESWDEGDDENDVATLGDPDSDDERSESSERANGETASSEGERSEPSKTASGEEGTASSEAESPDDADDDLTDGVDDESTADLETAEDDDFELLDDESDDDFGDLLDESSGDDADLDELLDDDERDA